MNAINGGPGRFGTMMTLAQLSALAPTPRPSGESVAQQAQRILNGINATLQNPSLATAGQWTAVWIALSADGGNLLYIAAGPGNTFAVSCRGTQFNSLVDLAEDMQVGAVEQFTPGGAANPLLVSAGAMKAFTDSTSAPGVGATAGNLRDALSQLLSAAAGTPTVCVTGHSLGGAMATMIALYLKGETLPKSPSFEVYTFAAPTAGLASFASFYDKTFGSNAYRIYNQYDAVPYAWANLAYVQNNLYPTPSAASPANPGPAQTVAVKELLKTLAQAPGPNVYVQTTGSTTVYNADYSTRDPDALHPTTGDFLAQVGFQHNCYLALLGAPPLPAPGEFGGPPGVSGVTPNTGSAAGGTLVTIRGGKFTPDCVVDFGTVPAVVTSISVERITAMQPPGVGTVDVRVTNMYGTSPATPGDRFAAPHPLGPTITNVDPASGPAGVGYTITGTGFADDIGPFSVTMGANAPVVSSTLTEITVVAPQSGSGVVPVQVSSKQGSATWSGQFQFGVPLVLGVTPPAGVATGGGMVTITGNGFEAGCSVSFDDKTATPTSVRSNTIQVTAPSVLVPDPYKIVDVKVTNKPAKTSLVTPASKYVYYQKPKED